MIKLNIGCSSKTKKGWINVDCRQLPSIDMVVDLEAYPWPWPDNSVDRIYASHVIEHLANPRRAIQEMYRILKPGGIVEIYCPNAHGYLGIGIGHNSYLSVQSFLDMQGNNDYQEDTTVNFSKASIRLNVFHHNSKHPIGVLKPIVKVWEYIFNLNNTMRLYWEVLGILHPGEIYWGAVK